MNPSRFLLGCIVASLSIASASCDVTIEEHRNDVSCKDLIAEEATIDELAAKRKMATPCACSEQIMALDFTFRKIGNCYQEWMYHEGVKQMCCYGLDGTLKTGPHEGGYVVLEAASYNMSDVHRSCCQTSNALCETFYEINPSDDCSRYLPPVTVRSFGDPTITTIDGVSYGFNGHGEYVFLKTKGMEIQARTEYITEGNKDATMFTAFTFHDENSNTSIELNLDRGSKSIIVYQNGSMLCNSSGVTLKPCVWPPPPCFVLAGSNKVLLQGCAIGTFAKSVTIKSGEMMAIEFDTQGKQTDKFNITGLMGITRNASFVSRNGTLTPVNASESAIFDFGETWALQNFSESWFDYKINRHNFSFYNSNHTRPRFLEDLVGNLTELFKNYSSTNITKFNQTCRNYWDNQPSTECLLTIARNNDYSRGVAVMKGVNETRRIWEANHNSKPYFASNITSHSVITVIPHGNNTSFSIDLSEYAFDNDSNSQLRFRVDTDIPEIDYTLDDHGAFKWNFTDSLRNITLTRLNFYVFDNFNSSDMYSMYIRYCGCEHGIDECAIFPEVDLNTTKDTGHVITATCECDHYTGTYCEKRVDPCTIYTCENGCNSSVEIGQIPCLPCNAGYEGDGTSCTDIDECDDGYIGDDRCQQLCNNTDGSFTCICKHGYVLNEDKHSCDDINECSLGEKCPNHEVCTNIPGDFKCICMPGYMRKTENGSCEEIGDGAIYVGYVIYDLSITKLTANINKTVDTLSNRQTMADRLDKMFKNTTHYLSVEVYKLSIVITNSNNTGRKKRETTMGKLNVDYVVHWAVTTSSSDTVFKSLAATVSSAKINPLPIPIGDFASLLPSTAELNPSNGTDVGVCSVPDQTDCDKLSTECQNEVGGFTCLCKTGFKEVKLSTKYCTDINECSEDSSIDERCVYGSCINQVGSWNCSCPSQKTWQNVGNVSYPVYRCQGNFSYIGFTRLIWKGDNNTEKIKTLIENELTSLFRNESLERPMHNIPISDLMVSATVLEINQTQRFSNGSMEIRATYNLQMGEIVDVSRVADVLRDVAPRIGLQPNATFVHFHIYNDTENILCKLTDNGGCDVDSSMCEQTNGSTVCSCRAGFTKKSSSSKFCSDVNECDLYSPTETCSGLGKCHNEHLGYSCTCNQGYFENASNPLNVTCDDIDECESEKFLCDKGICTNTIGGWDCMCNGAGYIRTNISSSTVQCTDIDECHNSSYHCDGTCTNNDGGWDCSCSHGYNVSKNSNTNITCSDIDECAANQGQCIGGSCHNSEGSWSCACNKSNYKPVNKSSDTYRCMGDFQYIGEMTLVSLSEIKKNNILDLFHKEITNMFKEYDTNVTVPPSPSNETVPMSEIFQTIEVLNQSIKISHDPTTYRATVKYIVHIGEPLTFAEVNVTFSVRPNLGSPLNMKVIENTIFNDTEFNLCNVEGKTLCDDRTTNCLVSRGNYSCECMHGYKNSSNQYSCENIDECEDKSITCAGGGTCVDSIGNWTCNCNDTTEFHRYNDSYGACEDKDECSYPDLYKCKGGNCSNRNNGWNCTCANGYQAEEITKDYAYVCGDIDECHDLHHKCSNGGTCKNTQGNWTCECPSGFEPAYVNETFVECKDIDECVDPRFTCDGPTNSSATCSNIPGSWYCNCSKGFNTSKNTTFVKSCADIDECTLMPNLCQNGGTCVNSVGKYNCTCPSGYNVIKIKEDAYNYTCQDIDECRVYGKDRACMRALSCENIPGDWVCTCSDGLDPIVVNSSSKICGGGYQYVATIRFTVYKQVNNTIIFSLHLEDKLEDLYTHAYPGVKMLIEILPIIVPPKINDNKGVMVTAKYIVQTVMPMNRTQLYRVQDFYREQKCTKGPCDLDEIGTNPITFQEIVVLNNSAICATPRNICNNTLSDCVSNDGQLDCECTKGYRKTLTNSFQCLDIDECSNSTYKCNGGYCQNSNGAWDCECNAGYQGVSSEPGTNITCEDIDECSDADHVCTNGGTCKNSIGNWSCGCPQGFEIGFRNNSIIDCSDIDECTMTDYCSGFGGSAICSNTFGSWSCGCKAGFTLVDSSPTNKSCKGGNYSYGFSLTLTTTGDNINITAITITLQNKIEELYANTLNDPAIWIEILSINGQPVARRKRQADDSELSVKYIVHTSKQRDESQLTRASANISNVLKSDDKLEYLIVDVSNVTGVGNSDFCPLCNSASTACYSTKDSFRCVCRPGFETDPDNDYECSDKDECKMKDACMNGSNCENTPGSFSCPCKDGFIQHQTDSKETICADPCTISKCHETSVCTKYNNEDGYKCGCAAGRLGKYCQESEGNGTSDKSILIATGSTLGAVVIILSVVVFVVCRWRAAKIKEAEKMSMKHMDNSGFKDFEDDYLADQYIRRNENRSVYSHRISNGSFQGTKSLDGVRRSYVNNGGNSQADGKPVKLPKPQYRSSMPELVNVYNAMEQNGLNDSPNYGNGQFSSLERGRYGNGVGNHYHNGYQRNGRSSPTPDYEPQADYRTRDSPNESRDSGVGNGYPSSGFYIDDDVHKRGPVLRADTRGKPIGNSTKF